MGKYFQNDDSAEPPVQQVECIEGHVEPVYERIISSRHDELGNLN